MDNINSAEIFKQTKNGIDSEVCDVPQFSGVVTKKRKLFETKIDYMSPGLRESSFGQLSEETMFHILYHLSFDDLSRMSMASKAINKVVFTHTMSERFTVKIAGIMLTKCSPKEQQEQSSSLGRMLKRISFLYPVLVRLKFFQHHITQVQRWITFHSSKETPPVDTLAFIGGVLQSLVAGWDEGECYKVYSFISECFHLYRSIAKFVNETPGSDNDNEIFLRRNLRSLFLDPCSSDYDRATYIACISDQVGTAPLAKVLLLLYGPLDAQGKIDWNFGFHVRAFQKHTGVFIILARIIGTLQLLPNWSPYLSLEVLVYVSNVPNCWLLRSFSSLLLPLSCIDKELVTDYFLVLYKSGRASTASLLLALALMISPQFRNTNGGIYIEKTCVHNLINMVINSQKLTLERFVIVKKLWDAVLSLADDFAETAIQEFEADFEGGHDHSVDDYHDLMDAWKDLSTILMMD